MVTGALRLTVAAPLLLQINPADFAWVEDASIAMIAVLTLVVVMILFYRRIIVWGSTCDRLLANKDEQIDAERAGKEEARRDLAQLSKDFSEHLGTVLRSFGER